MSFFFIQDSRIRVIGITITKLISEWMFGIENYSKAFGLVMAVTEKGWLSVKSPSSLSPLWLNLTIFPLELKWPANHQSWLLHLLSLFIVSLLPLSHSCLSYLEKLNGFKLHFGHFFQFEMHVRSCIASQKMTCVIADASWGPWEEAEEVAEWIGLLVWFWQDELIHPWTAEIGTRILPKIPAAWDNNQPMEQKWNTLFMV